MAYSAEHIHKFGRDFSCFYIMSKLHNLDRVLGNRNGLYHILKNDYSQFNKPVGRVYGEPISEFNPSRGFFATYDYIENTVLGSLDSPQRAI
jgi:hypothetical protein